MKCGSQATYIQTFVAMVTRWLGNGSILCELSRRYRHDADTVACGDPGEHMANIESLATERMNFMWYRMKDKQ